MSAPFIPNTTSTPSRTNRERIARAQSTLAHYSELAQISPQEGIYDLVTDLLHLAASQGIDPHGVTEWAQLHYEAEHG